MRRPGGLLITVSELGTKEVDTFTCKHCNKIVEVQPRCDPADMGGRCNVCDGLICPSCVGKGCDVIEEKLKRWEHQATVRQDYARSA